MTTVPQEAVKAAAKCYLERAVSINETASSLAHAMLTAALPYLPQGVGVKVKPLEWGKSSIGERDKAQTVVGSYFIGDPAPGSYNVLFDNDQITALLTVCPSLEAAKSAAQADYEARILSALVPSAGDMGNPITITYTNYRGETSERTITPIRPWYGSTEWHPEPQWLLKAYDHDKGAERDFAFKDIGNSQPSAARSLALEERLQAIEQQLVVNLGYFHDEKRILLETLQSHIISHISAIRALSSPDHADAGKTVHEYAQTYEWRGDSGDYVPTDAERAMIEDAIEGFIADAGKVEGGGWLPSEYEVYCDDELVAASNDLREAMNYAANNAGGGVVELVEVRRRPIPSAPSLEVAGS